MSDSDRPRRGEDSADDLSQVEHEAEAARRKLADAERRADETLKQAEDELEKKGARLDADAERLRRELHEPPGPRKRPGKDSP